MPNAWIGPLKDGVAIAQGCLTTLAILAGGYWFLLQRSTKPQVKLDQTVTQRRLAGVADQMLVTVDVRATNVGKTRVELAPGHMEMIYVNPSPGDDLYAFPLKSLVLEPGESDQALFKVVILPAAIKTIQIHSDYAVPKARRAYWNLLSVVDLGAEGNREVEATSVP